MDLHNTIDHDLRIALYYPRAVGTNTPQETESVWCNLLIIFGPLSAINKK